MDLFVPSIFKNAKDSCHRTINYYKNSPVFLFARDYCNWFQDYRDVDNVFPTRIRYVNSS